MYSLINKNKTRYFELETPNGKVLHIKPPKLATLRKTEELSDTATVAETSEVVAAIMASNRENVKVTSAMVEQWMDGDQLKEFAGEFISWMKGERESDPN